MSQTFHQSIVEEFRANGGKVGGPFEGSDLLLLTTSGATSGKPHTVPLGCVRDGDLLLVVGSNLGAPRHPDWYLNLLAHPQVQVEFGTEAYEAIAVPAEGERRERLFAQVVSVAPGYADYQAGTARALPVVVLEPAEPEYEEADGANPRAVHTLADKLVQVHTWLRAQLRHVRTEAEAHLAALAAHQGPGAAPAPGLGLQIRQHCLAFCQSLEFHHTGEDAHIFPTVARYHPELRPALDRLQEEHRTIARIQNDLLGLLADIGNADPKRFLTDLERMSGELRAHLAYEEEQLIPALADVPWPPPAPSASPDTPASPAPSGSGAAGSAAESAVS
ncbi:cation-binding protein [Streptomyces sp. CB02923]|uniref:nitroreductase/quinone reductase family protein n=1 Tax=Streptomyces sp. CB02923 TaxID=1718985 RepID=UPI00093DB561|nr:nitroreductase/quinone reductase family protein [Streptomyces sp. CB02923]OKI04563.1 cation-binding protein [Streptomyces sp. CB02923]